MIPEPRHEIPEEWTGDYALALVGFLEGIIGAVWHRHGVEMCRQLQRRGESYGAPPDPADEFFDQLDAEIPF